MEFQEVVRSRVSVREFRRDGEVTDEQVDRILEAAVDAPSAGNRQPWHFIVVRDRALRLDLARAAYGQAFVSEAPIVIAVCVEPARSSERYGGRGTELYCLQDAAAATEHILLAATDLGLGTCWVGAFDEREAARALGLSKQLRPVALVPIGQPAREPGPRPARRPLREVITYR